jgi:ABC-type Mn2+/Zn2+ transport system ATPase subunit
VRSRPGSRSPSSAQRGRQVDPHPGRLGLVPLTSGTIEVLGRPPQTARRQVAYVPQADTLDPEFPVSALQVVLMGRYPRVGWLRRPGRPTARPPSGP